MAKIQSRIGSSLASIYDVRGSVAGVEELRSEEVVLSHDMGQCGFSERLGGDITRDSVALGQSANVAVVISDLPDVPFMLHAITVFSDDATRINRLAVLARLLGPPAREIPLWVYANTVEVGVRFVDDGAGAALHTVLRPIEDIVQLPQLMMGTDQPAPLAEIAMRGDTTAFGAGSVQITVLLKISFSQLRGLNSFGLPIPSW